MALRRAPVLVTMMFAGLRSRCAMPTPCEELSASSTCIIRCTASTGSSAPSRVSTSANVLPGTSSKTA